MGFKFHAEPFISIAVKHAPFNAPHIETPRSYEPLAEGLLKATADSGNSPRLYLTIRYGACVSGFFDADFHGDFSSRCSAISSRSVRITNQLRRLCVGFMSSTFHGERFTRIITPAFQFFPVRRKKSGRRSTAAFKTHAGSGDARRLARVQQCKTRKLSSRFGAWLNRRMQTNQRMNGGASIHAYATR
ncbi:hypothetical protein [Paraburkholderia sp. Ac-20347]|uniref:hypothetical protein n=1 Tax=Paraburkholderia sp. Ac-20347 TaxID=2703892 RepID=UPI00197CD51A|nr:hypothetical protein [Paraburkholderia sp. Ac-20347]MBN3807549.1 hypothetical protein [Paraburkholderia sp. Ac-20347]